MAARVLDLAAGYFGHPAFPGRLLHRRYAEHLENRRLQGY
jgi:hypothetical protein